MNRLAFALVFIFSTLTLRAQLDNSVFDWSRPVAPTDSNQLFLGVHVLGFGKNNEYFDTVIEGYTLFGYQLNPYLSYHPGEHLRLDGGIYLQKDFGNNRYSTIEPTLSVKYQLGHFTAVFGTLDGNLSHQLIEPMYDFERALNKRLEDGLQLRWQSDDLFVDTWVDWQHMIYPNDTSQEHIWGGLSIEKTYHFGDWSLGIPLQGTALHHGGQINVGNEPLATILHGAAGIDLVHHGDLFDWGAKAYATVYSDRSSRSQQVFQDGNGYLINPFVTYRKRITLMGSYWNGFQYVTLMGSDLYASVSSESPGPIDQLRIFYMARLLYNVPLAHGTIFTLRAEALYDTFSKSIQYNYGIYVNFSGEYYLTHAKNR